MWKIILGYFVDSYGYIGSPYGGCVYYNSYEMMANNRVENIYSNNSTECPPY